MLRTINTKMRENTGQLIDERNIQLWNTLNKKYNILILESFESNYMSCIKKKKLFRKQKAIIYILRNNLCSASFTHELLHIYLASQKVFIGDDLIKLIFANNNLYKIFSRNLRDHVCNCLEHAKMLPIYSELGYENENFISDFHKPKITIEEIELLQIKFSDKSKYYQEAIDFYIGKFFAMKACNNNSFNYEKYYCIFKKLDSQLFDILDNFWSSWIYYDIKKEDNNYIPILRKFENELNNWITEKTIIFNGT